MGHEFSVYIGPVLAYLVFRYRRCVLAGVPRDDRRRLIAVSIIALGLGLGSWRVHDPAALPLPFDLLSALPGFRTVALPARFWGFLALPSLFGALAIGKFEEEPMPGKARVALGAALVLASRLNSGRPQPFLSSRGRVRIADAPFREDRSHRDRARPDRVAGGACLDAASSTPTRTALRELAGSDLIRAAVSPSGEPVRRKLAGTGGTTSSHPDRARPRPTSSSTRTSILWGSSVGAISRTEAGNLVVDLPASESVRHPEISGSVLLLGQRSHALDGRSFRC
jgi:hypothetical protein